MNSIREKCKHTLKMMVLRCTRIRINVSFGKLLELPLSLKRERKRGETGNKESFD